MRILANYGYRDNGNSYTVSFETLGDVPIERAPEEVNKLFRLAKGAVMRQLELNEPSPSHGPTTEDPRDTVPVPSNPSEVAVNGNGNIKIKDPTLPASQKQVSFLRKLAKQKNVHVETTGLNKLEASQLIDSMMNR